MASVVSCSSVFSASAKPYMPRKALGVRPVRALAHSGPSDPTDRRRLLLGAGLAAAVTPLFCSKPAAADEAAAAERRAFFDVLIDGQPAGRIVVEILSDSGLAGTRFADLARGVEGVGYRRSRIELLEDK